MSKLAIILLLVLNQVSPQKDTLEEHNYRHWVIATEVVSGIGVYSWLLPAGLNLEGKGAVALGLWTPAITFGTSWLATSGKVVKSSGTPYGCLLGSYDGMVHGFFLNPSGSENPFILPLIFSVGENVLGYQLGERLRLGVGDVQRHFNYSLLGYFHAGMLQWMADLDFDEWRYLYPSLSIVEGYGISLATRKDRVSFANALTELGFMRVGITSPSSILLGIDLFSEDETFSSKLYVSSMLIGSICGAYIGHKLSHSYDISLAGSIITLLAPTMVNGMVYGTYVLLVEDTGTAGTLLILTGISDAVGTWLSYRMFSKPK